MSLSWIPLSQRTQLSAGFQTRACDNPPRRYDVCFFVVLGFAVTSVCSGEHQGSVLIYPIFAPFSFNSGNGDFCEGPSMQICRPCEIPTPGAFCSMLGLGLLRCARQETGVHGLSAVHRAEEVTLMSNTNIVAVF